MSGILFQIGRDCEYVCQAISAAAIAINVTLDAAEWPEKFLFIKCLTTLLRIGSMSLLCNAQSKHRMLHTILQVLSCTYCAELKASETLARDLFKKFASRS